MSEETSGYQAINMRALDDGAMRQQDTAEDSVSRRTDVDQKKKKRKKQRGRDESYESFSSLHQPDMHADHDGQINPGYDAEKEAHSTRSPETDENAAYTEEPEVEPFGIRKSSRGKANQSKQKAKSKGLDNTSQADKKQVLEDKPRCDDETTGNENRFDSNDIISFIREKKFHRMTCGTFIYNNTLSKERDIPMCGCGRAKTDHTQTGDQTNSSNQTEWNSEEHSQSDEHKQNHYGTIAFKGFGQITDYQAPYVVLSSRDSRKDACNFLLHKWKLPTPKLIVSVIGGAKRFKFSRTRVTHLFKQGLIEVATSTGAWIITPGTGTGVYKLIGDAISDYINTEESVKRQDIVVLGIAAWGAVDNRKCLKNSIDKMTKEYSGRFPAEYCKSSLTPDSKLSLLDANHTHFILVDDGSQNKYGGEIQWRVLFERYLNECVESKALESMELKPDDEGEREPEPKSLPIQIVTILVNGGVGSITNIAKILEHKPYPIIAIAGSGRAAEAVIRIAQLNDKTYSDYALKKAYRDAMGSYADEHIMKKLKTIYDNRKYVTVFDFEKEPRNDVSTGLDNGILNALHKLQTERATMSMESQKATMSMESQKATMSMESQKAQMNLALAWNKVTYAQREILDINNSDYKQLISDKAYMHEVLMTAIIRNLDEFVLTLLDHGIDLDSFVTPANLLLLYKKMESKDDSYSRFANSLIKVRRRTRSCLCTCCARNTNKCPSDDEQSVEFHHLWTIGRTIQSLIGDFYPNEYDDGNILSQTLKDHPAKHLFYWAVMFNRYDMARIFLRHCKDYLGGAMVGASIYRGLSRKSDHDEGVEMTSTYKRRLSEFEESAIGILSKCWEKNRSQTSKMLVRAEPHWGGSTLMSMADNAQMQKFLAQDACHTKLTKIWRGNIALRTPFYWIILFALLPPFGVWLLQFARRNNGEQRLDEAAKPKQQDEKNSNEGNNPASTAYKVSWSGTGSSISYCNAIWQAWHAPMVRFIYYIFWYVGFLICYSLMIMTELAENSSVPSNLTLSSCSVDTKPFFGYLESRPNIGPLEIITWVICACNLFEEIRQIVHQDERNCKSKLRDWWSDLWNKLDVISYIIFILSIILRFSLSGPCFFHARWMYCISLALFFLRFFQTFYVIEQLGPKIIMIHKMLIDVWFFLFLLIIVICTFGVMYQALLHPQSALNTTLISSVFAKPYWQMYGELNLEEVVQSDNSSIATELILIIYMILTNVLLLNLLIAMFSHTFAEVQVNATILWKYHYYGLVYENADRPYFLPLGSIYKFIKKSCGDGQSLFKVKLGSEEDKKISSLIGACTESYQKQVQRRKHEDVASKVTSTAERLDSVISQLDDLREDIALQPRAETSPTQQPQTPELYPDHQSLLEKVSRLETNMERMFNRLEEKLTNMQQNEGSYR